MCANRDYGATAETDRSWVKKKKKKKNLYCSLSYHLCGWIGFKPWEKHSKWTWFSYSNAPHVNLKILHQIFVSVFKIESLKNVLPPPTSSYKKSANITPLPKGIIDMTTKRLCGCSFAPLHKMTHSYFPPEGSSKSEHLF